MNYFVSCFCVDGCACFARVHVLLLPGPRACSAVCRQGEAVQVDVSTLFGGGSTGAVLGSLQPALLSLLGTVGPAVPPGVVTVAPLNITTFYTSLQ